MLRPRRKWTVPLLLLGVIAVLSACGGGPREPGKIALAEGVVDFGTIPNSAPVTHTVAVRNEGPGVLDITGVSTSCGCTTAEATDRRLNPGEATDLVIVFDPQSHGGEIGTFLRQVYVRSSDPDAPEAVLTFRVTVVEQAESSGRP